MANLRLGRFVGDRLARQAIMYERRIECDSEVGRMICDEVVAPDEIDATIVRVIDRPDSRRVLAMTVSGQPVEFDTAPEFPHRKGEAGFLQIRRPRIYAAA